MSEIKMNGFVYSYDEDTIQEVRDYLDMHADAVYEKGKQRDGIPDHATEIELNGMVYVFYDISGDTIDYLDYRATSVREDK